MELCLGTEDHYLWKCPSTRHHWNNTREIIQNKLDYDIGADTFHWINNILEICAQRDRKINNGQLRILTYHLSKMCSDLLNDTAGIFLPFNTDA